jgi:hypothetical protein
MFEAIFDWPVVAIVVGLLIGAGFSVLSMNPPRYRIAEACYAISALLLWAKFSFWAVTSNGTWKERLLVAFLVFGTSGTLLILVLSWVESIVPKEAVAASEVPVIEMSYDMHFGPLAIGPYAAITAIRVIDRQKVESATIQNPEPKVLTWPKPEVGGFPQSVGIIKIANHGTVPVFNISATVRFDVGAQKSPSGTSTLNFHLPLVESLRPTDPAYQFYVVDESALGGLVVLPDTATAEVQGVDGRHTVKIAIRKLTFMDNIPMLPPVFQRPAVQPQAPKRKRKGKK